MHVPVHACAQCHSSYMTLIGVHKMHGRVPPNYCHVTNLFVHGPFLSSGYPKIIYTHPIANNLPIKILIARQLQTHTHTHTHTHHTHMLNV